MIKWFLSSLRLAMRQRRNIRRQIRQMNRLCYTRDWLGTTNECGRRAGQWV